MVEYHHHHDAGRPVVADRVHAGYHRRQHHHLVHDRRRYRHLRAERKRRYSQSYGTSDVTIEVFSNTVDEWLVWNAALVGCHNYEWYPDYSGASDAAKSTYTLDPSFIAAVPNDAKLAFTTTADGDSDEWGFTVEKVKLECDFACAGIDSTTYSSSYSNPISATCNSTSCS